MPPTEHSPFSPSSMADKLLCPGRHKATEGMGGGSSPAAERGTECHAEAEKYMRDPDNYLPPTYVAKWQEQCTNDMVNHTLDMQEALEISGPVDTLLEEVVNLSLIAGDGFDMSQVYGTCDVILNCDANHTMVMLDYKTGTGIIVDPKENVQLMIYALGAMAKFPGAEKIIIAVSQPRVYDELQTWETTRVDLLQWARTVLVPGLKVMVSENPIFVPGEKQCFFCAIKGKCRAQKEDLLSLLDDHPEPAATGDNILSKQEINDLLLRVKEFRQWVNQIEGVAQGMMEHGDKLESFKLVRGRSIRQWSTPEEGEKFLIGQKIPKWDRYTHKILSPTQTEKLLKDKLKKTARTRNLFRALVTKPEGKITWAPRTDKRAEVVMNPLAELVSLEDLM